MCGNHWFCDVGIYQCIFNVLYDVIIGDYTRPQDKETCGFVSRRAPPARQQGLESNRVPYSLTSFGKPSMQANFMRFTIS